MDALTLLIADHNRVRGLFERFRKAEDAKHTANMSSLVETIFTELEVHTAIEEEIFYPETHDLSDEIGDTVDEGVQEHHGVKVLMSEIEGLSPGDDDWVAKMTVLMENVEHHAEEEENELFRRCARIRVQKTASRWGSGWTLARASSVRPSSPTRSTSPTSGSASSPPNRPSPAARRWITTSSQQRSVLVERTSGSRTLGELRSRTGDFSVVGVSSAPNVVQVGPPR